MNENILFCIIYTLIFVKIHPFQDGNGRAAED